MNRTTLAGIASCALLLMALSPPDPKPIDLPGDRLFPESLAIAADGIAFVGSLNGGILRVDLATGTVAQWVQPGGFGTSSTFGLFADEANKLLWVCSNDLGFAGVQIAGADKGTYVKAFDLRTGQGKLSLRLPGERAFCNDFAVGANGTVYVTDTTSSHILRWTPGSTSLEDWYFNAATANNGGGGLDGIAYDGEGHLYVNNFEINRLARIAIKPDGSAGDVTVLETSRPMNLPDGLRALDATHLVQAEGGGTVSLVTIKGNKAELTTLADDVPAATGVGAHQGTAWFVRGHLSYIFNPALRTKSPPLPFQLTPARLPRNF